MSRYPHLDPRTQDIMEGSEEARIAWVLQPRWIGYTKAHDALNRLEWLMRYPPTHRMPNLLLVGHTNNGKTCIVQHFAECYPPTPPLAAIQSVLPILSERG